MKLDIEIESENSNRLRKSLAVTEKDLKIATDELITSKKQVDRMRKEAVELQDELRLRDDENMDLKQEILEMENEAHEQAITIEQLEAQINTIQDEVKPKSFEITQTLLSAKEK